MYSFIVTGLQEYVSQVSHSGPVVSNMCSGNYCNGIYIKITQMLPSSCV